MRPCRMEVITGWGQYASSARLILDISHPLTVIRPLSLNIFAAVVACILLALPDGNWNDICDGNQDATGAENQQWPAATSPGFPLLGPCPTALNAFFMHLETPL